MAPYVLVTLALLAVAAISLFPLVVWLVTNSALALSSAYFYFFLLPPTLFGLLAAVSAFVPIRRRRHPWWAMIPASLAFVGVLLLTVGKPLIGQLEF